MYAAAATVRSSAILSNAANWYGGQLAARGGGIYAASLELTNSTVSGNAARQGGGIAGVGTVVHSTFAGNDGQDGSSIKGMGSGVTISSSIFATRLGDDHCTGTIAGLTGNLADDATCDPSFGTLTDFDTHIADNGGPTKTHKLLAGSTAIDPLPGGCGLGTDQRGAGRMGSCDSGAYEYLGDGCDLVELEQLVIDTAVYVPACHTLLLGSDLVVVGPSGHLDAEAGYLVGLRPGFEVRNGATLTISIDSSLLP